jgi:maleate isomerase
VIGLIVPSNDPVIEAEMRTFTAAVNGVIVLASRVLLAGPISPQKLGHMLTKLPQALSVLMPDDRLDVLAFGCTSGAMAIGPEKIVAVVTADRPGLPVTDPVTASVAALNRLKARRIAILTPYPDLVNAVVYDFFSAQGFKIGAQGSFKQSGDATISRIPPEAIYGAGVALGSRDVDALFVSCTALRTSGVIERIEREIGKPVVTSNQALAGHSLRLARHHGPIAGFGQILRM